jgi:hypothetical protein
LPEIEIPPTSLEPKQRRVWWIVLVLVVAVILLPGGWLLVERYRAKAALAKYEQQLRARGEKLKFEELLTPIPEGDNKGPELLGLCSSLVDGPVLILNSPPTMRLIAPGKALLVTKEEGWLNGKEFFRWEQAGSDIEVNNKTLRAIGDVVRSPVLRMPLRYDGVRTRLPHLASFKKAAQWLSASCLYSLHTGDINSAINNIESIVLISAALREEPILLSGLVRAALLVIGFSDCWLVLQTPGLSEEQLVRLQHALEGTDLAGPMIFVLRGERAMCRDTIRDLRDSKTSSKEIVDTLSSFSQHDEGTEVQKHVEKVRDVIRADLVVPLWRFTWSYDDERHVLEEMEVLLTVCEQFRTQRSIRPLENAQRTFKRKAGSDGAYQSWQYWATGGLISYLPKAPLRACRYEAQREMTIAAIALKRYQLRHGKYPKTLDELVPEFLREVPVDWMDGQKLRYRPEGETFVLWSVGEDGKDDNGTPNQSDSPSFWNGKDFVWPQPASEAEVSAYHAKKEARR